MRKIFTLLFLPFIFLLSLSVQAQQRTITGKVTSADDGLPMPGVGVKVKGTTTSNVTTGQGTYSISVPNNNAVLVFTYLGFVGQEITVGSKSTVNAVLVADVSQLQEVVINTGLALRGRPNHWAMLRRVLREKTLTLTTNLICLMPYKVK